MSLRVFVGIDVGSSATKCVVLDGQAVMLGHHVLGSGFDYTMAAETGLTKALEKSGVAAEQVAYCVSTGYGRAKVPPADRQVTEITCHARGARRWHPDVRDIIDIGGQDTKVIHLNAEGRMTDYRMNAKCAAGTGTFLEAIALKLGVSMAELDELAMRSKSAQVVNSYCTVFAGTEVIERIKAGQSREDISMGLFRSIATRVSEMMASREGPVAVTGGVPAYCSALVRAVKEVLAVEVYLPPMPQLAGAFGAALIAMEDADVKRSQGSHVASR